MLEIVVPGCNDLWDEANERFINKSEDCILQLEHSLVAISKWEAKYHKTFLSKTKVKTTDEMLDYIRFMTLNKVEDDTVYYRLTNENIHQIEEYMKNTMSATKVPKSNTNSSEPMTSELIYFYMIELNIPVEFQEWHINRLIQLINVCAFKKEKPKKMNRTDIFKRNAEINARNQERLKLAKEAKHG